MSHRREARCVPTTCSHAHRPALTVIATRFVAISDAVSVHDPTGHPLFGRDQRRLDHTSRDGRPKQGRSTSSTRSRSFALPEAPHPEQLGRSRRVSTCTRTGWPGWSSTARMFTSGKPTRSSHMRVGLVSTGGLGASVGVGTADSSGPCTAPGGPPATPSHPAQTRIPGNRPGRAARYRRVRRARSTSAWQRAIPSGPLVPQWPVRQRPAGDVIQRLESCPGCISAAPGGRRIDFAATGGLWSRIGALSLGGQARTVSGGPGRQR